MKKLLLILLLLMPLFAYADCPAMRLTGVHPVPLNGAHGLNKCSCSSCHQGARIAPRIENNCAACHATGRGSAMQAPATHIPFAGADCSNCHRDTLLSFKPADFRHQAPWVNAGGCLNCHNGSHNGAGARGLPNDHIPTSGASCDNCHKSTSSWDAKMAHSVTTTPAGGCNTCHLTGRGDATRMPSGHLSTTASCDTCHTTGYTTFSNGRYHANNTPVAGSCGTCHSMTPVLGAMGQQANHKVYQLTCEQCHLTTNSWSCEL